MLDKRYPGEHIGVEPTTDKFVSVMHGAEDRVIPGNAAAVNQELPFRGLNRFGQAFLSRFQVSMDVHLQQVRLLMTFLSGFSNTITSFGEYDYC